MEAGDGNLAEAKWRSVHRLISQRLDAVKRKLEQWDTASEEPAAGKTRGLRHWLPALIVLASLASATMGWQASIADERATTKDELSRQDLVAQQQVDLQKVQQVDSDIRLYGQAVEESYVAGALQNDAAFSARPARRLFMAEANGDEGVARWLGGQIQFGQALTIKPRPAYHVGTALLAARSSDPALASLDPGRLRVEAQAQRTRGLHLVGLAVGFIVALVFFTVAAVAYRQGPDLSGAGVHGVVSRFRGPEALSYWFVALGGAFFFTALTLFPFVRGII